MSPICPTLLLLLATLPLTLLAQTSDRMVTTVQEALETRLAAETASIETRQAAQTAALETRLAAQTAALHEKIASLEGRLTAATQDIGGLVTAFLNASSQMAECCGRPVPTASPTVRPSTTPTTTPSTTPTTTKTPRGIVFLRRQDGSVDFYRGWAAYKSGFGNQAGEFWLGLDNLYDLTTRHNYGLRVDLTDWSGETKWTAYSTFRVAGEESRYRLTVARFNPTSTAGNAMWRNGGQRFTTRDRDNDVSSGSCADVCQGAWWYGWCTEANPAGPYKPAGYRGRQGIYWYKAYNDHRSFKHITLTLINP